MPKIKFTPVTSTLANAISAALGTLTELGEEAREIVDNASDGLSQTERIQTLGETADTLEAIDEPDIPDWLGPTEVKYSAWQNSRKGRPLSRANRCAEAVAILEAAIEVLEAEAEDADTDKKETIETLKDALDTAKGEAEGCEFPGMFG